MSKSANKSADRAGTIYRVLRRAIIEQALQPGAKLPEDAIGERFGVSHAEAGQHLMRHWRFPLTLRQVVASPAAGDLPGSLIQLAVQVASQVSPDPLHTTPGPSGVDQDALVRLAWGQAEVDWFVAEVGAQLTDAESELGGTQLGDAA